MNPIDFEWFLANCRDTVLDGVTPLCQIYYRPQIALGREKVDEVVRTQTLAVVRELLLRGDITVVDPVTEATEPGPEEVDGLIAVIAERWEREGADLDYALWFGPNRR
jgi:hypothetical protein